MSKINLRKTKEYKVMTPYLACAYAEGFCEGEGASKTLELIAWQFIWDNKLHSNLQGFYSKTVNELIKMKLIKK